MSCFHFTSGGEQQPSDGGKTGGYQRKLTWARSLSVASTNLDSRRSEVDAESRRDWESRLLFNDFLAQRMCNDLRVFSFSELKSATRGFSRSLIIGEGGFGCVYRGRIQDSDTDVAIKQLNRNGFQGHEEWINEVIMLGVLNHPNLVKLVGYCADDDERGIQRLLVYELMPNKSLEDHLLSRSNAPLPWSLRLRIARDAARGLAYLHEEMEFQLIFRDLKTSNVLLDENFNAKLSDFGFARQGPAAGSAHVSSPVVGTVGYAAPEYLHTGRLTVKSDVWSFGIVLFELITGRRVIERNLPRDEQQLLDWVKPYVGDPKKFHMILDPRLQGESCMESAQKLVSLANKCLLKNPKSRPKMSEVVQILESISNETVADCMRQAANEEMAQEAAGVGCVSVDRSIFFLKKGLFRL